MVGKSPILRFILTRFLFSTTFVRDSYVNFIPVARIVGHCAVAETNVKLDYRIDKVIVCVPLLKSALV